VFIFAFLSLASIPIPLVLIRYGKELRARSRYAQEARRVITGMGAYKNEVMRSNGNLDDLAVAGKHWVVKQGEGEGMRNR
jgi:hypothetical protein